MGALARAARASATDADTSAALRSGLGQCRGRCTAVCARLRRASQAENRDRPGAAEIHSHGVWRGLSLRTGGRGALVTSGMIDRAMEPLPRDPRSRKLVLARWALVL